MTTSRTTFDLSPPKDREQIPSGLLEYMQTRNRMHAFTLVQKEFERSGISQAELADRLGKGPDVVCRVLGAPGNWTLDTVSDYLWAISGAEIDYKLSYPLEKPARNNARPEWLTPSDPDVDVSGLSVIWPSNGLTFSEPVSEVANSISRGAA